MAQFLIIRDIHNDLLRINVDNISFYKAVGVFTEITMSSEIVQTDITIEELDEILKRHRLKY